MTAGGEALTAPPATGPPVAHLARVGRGDVDTAVLRLVTRLVRRSTLLMAVALAVYALVEVVSYTATYPDAAARARLAALADDPALRMMQGVPYRVETIGGFVVWDGGWALESIVAVWALLTATKLLRGEEDAERSELVLAAPVRAGRQVALVLAVVSAASCVVGAAVALAMTAGGAGWRGSVVLGSALALVGALWAGVGAVSAQLFGLRRHAAGAAAAVLLAGYLLRMVANAGDATGWVRWLSPYGWFDVVHAYGEPALLPLALLLATAVLLAAAAVRLRARRDLGGAALAGADHREPRLHLLGGTTAFAWRSNQGVLLAWAVGLGVYAAVMGALLRTVVDFVAKEPTYGRMLRSLGMDAGDVARGFVGFLALTFGLLVALYACWRVGAARAEESAGRLDLVLARPVRRWRWLGAHALLTAVGAALLAVVCGLCLWLGTALTGADVTFVEALRATANPLPVAAVAAGLALLTLAVAPRLTVAVPVAFVVAAYVVDLVGSALDWPAAVVDASPFHHLAYVPAQPWGATSGTVLTVIGALLAVAALVLFGRRDVTGD